MSAGTSRPTGSLEDPYRKLNIDERFHAGLELDMYGIDHSVSGSYLAVLVRAAVGARYARVTYDLVPAYIPYRNFDNQTNGAILGVHGEVLARLWITDRIVLFNSVGPTFSFPLMNIEGYGDYYLSVPPYTPIKRLHRVQPYVNLDVRVGTGFSL